MKQDQYIITENQPFRILNAAVESGKMHHAYLLSGPEGAGKTAMAIHFALKLLCRNETDKPCYSCASCRKLREFCHPDFRIVFPFVSVDGFGKVAKELDLKALHAAKGNDEPTTEELYNFYLSESARDLLANPFKKPKITMEFEDKNREISKGQIRNIIDDFQMPPSESKYKVIILTEADKINRDAANAFLKTLEEPLSFMKFFLVTSKPHSLLPTIRSRCQEIKFCGLSKEEVMSFLVEREKAPKAMAHTAARFSFGSLPSALEFMDKDNSGLIDDAIDIMEWFTDKDPKKALGMADRFSNSSFTDSIKRLKFASQFMYELDHLKGDENEDMGGGIMERLRILSEKLPRGLFIDKYNDLMRASSAIEHKGNQMLVHAAMFFSFIEKR